MLNKISLIFLFLFITFCSTFSYSQGLINNGANIVLTSTSKIYIDGTTGNYKAQVAGGNQAVLRNTANTCNIYLEGNWTNNNTTGTGFSTTGSTVTFLGTTQTIGGTYLTAFDNLFCSGGGTKSVTFTATVSTLLTLGASTIVNSTSGYLTILSTAAKNANVAFIPSSSAITGDASIQAFINGGSAVKRYGRMMAPPVNDAFSLSGSKVFQQLKNYMVITGPGNTANGFDPGNASQYNAITLYKYNEPVGLSVSQFIPVSSLVTGSVVSANPGEGFFLFFRGNRDGYNSTTSFTSSKTNAPFAAPENVTMVYRGLPNQQDVPITLSRTVNGDAYDGLNLLGNPYSATIDFAQLVTNNSTAIANLYIILHPDNINGAMTYSMGLLINAVTITPASAQYIQTGQAFYVKKLLPSTNTYPSFFTEGLKAIAFLPARMMSLPSGNKLTTLMNTPASTGAFKVVPKALRFQIESKGAKNETAVVFQEGYKFEYENEDAPFMSGSAVNLSTLSSDNKSLAINFMPDLKKVEELKLDVDAASSGPVKITFTDLAGIKSYQIFLKDKFADKIEDVRSNAVYEFTIDKKNATSFGKDRLVILFKKPAVVPIQLTTFDANKTTTGGSNLQWTTKIEKETKYYDLERSDDNITFYKIGEVAGAGTSDKPINYNYFDKRPFVGTNYYRLKQVDDYENISYSSVVKLEFEDMAEEQIKISLYPNPAIDKLNVKLNLKNQSDIELVIVNQIGQQMVKQKYYGVGRKDILSTDISRFISGLYIVEIKDLKTNTYLGKVKLIKQ